jgi:hypothetical protein
MGTQHTTIFSRLETFDWENYFKNFLFFSVSVCVYVNKIHNSIRGGVTMVTQPSWTLVYALSASLSVLNVAQYAHSWWWGQRAFVSVPPTYRLIYLTVGCREAWLNSHMIWPAFMHYESTKRQRRRRRRRSLRRTETDEILKSILPAASIFIYIYIYIHVSLVARMICDLCDDRQEENLHCTV